VVEIYPADSVLVPGQDNEQCEFSQNAFVSRFSATHVAVSVPASQEQIEQIGQREGWRLQRCNRDSFFEVIEFWVGNRLMIELLPPAIAPQYLRFMQPQNLEQFFAPATTKI